MMHIHSSQKQSRLSILFCALLCYSFVMNVYLNTFYKMYCVLIFKYILLTSCIFLSLIYMGTQFFSSLDFVSLHRVFLLRSYLTAIIQILWWKYKQQSFMALGTYNLARTQSFHRLLHPEQSKWLTLKISCHPLPKHDSWTEWEEE